MPDDLRESNRHDDRARKLVQELADSCEEGGLGSASVSIYDTAWVSMITKNYNGQKQWLFPESFQYLLGKQLPDGSWESYASLEDGILNSLASLLALVRHSKAISDEKEDFSRQLLSPISKAKKSLEEKLQSWDVESGMNVGFEILVPTLLAMLENEHIWFHFPQRKLIQGLKESKMAGFDPQVLYQLPGTYLHSLEALVGVIDFDRLGQHKVFGSMMGSPASTAAYLMHSSTWDDEAELYLRKVINKGQGKGSGAVPSVFPIPVFEIAWVISTLLQANYSTELFDDRHLCIIGRYLQDHYQQQKGLVGFAPGMLPDADDTAKTIITLSQLGIDTDPSQMVRHFRTKQEHFSTYPGERNASFSANCNVLQALLHSTNVENHTKEISGITAFLCDSWWAGATHDKWNISLQYSMMLLAEVLVRLLELCDRGKLQLSSSLPPERLPVVLIQIVNQTLFTQSCNGSWGIAESFETTAYGILTLAAVSSIPWVSPVRGQIDHAIETGQHFLTQAQDRENISQYLWVEKVTYGSYILCESYLLAALRPSLSSHTWSSRISSLVQISEESVTRFSNLVSTLSLYRDQPLWRLEASAIEGHAFLPLLKSTHTDILPKQAKAKNEYMNFIPCTWVLVNNQQYLFLQANLLWDMMVLTVCNFRVDEFMENVVAKSGGEILKAVRSTISTLVADNRSAETSSAKRPQENSVIMKNTVLDTLEATKSYHFDLTGFTITIGHYIQEMLGHARIQQASLADRNHFSNELQAFLLAHIAQIEDNARFSAQDLLQSSTKGIFASARTSYYTWAHTIGTDSVSCPMSFAFFTCLLGALLSPKANPEICFCSVRSGYLARDLCTHLAVMSRLYNDYGSFARDQSEANVNSVNFPDFHKTHKNGPITVSESHQETQDWTQPKNDLLLLAQYEREMADLVGERLLSSLKSDGLRKDRSKADGVKLFMGVTALYADLYVARDLSNYVDKEM